MDQWCIERQGKRSTPCSLEKLKQLIASGAVRDDDLVWREGMPKAAPIKTLPAFASATPPTPAPTSAAPSPIVAAAPVPVAPVQAAATPPAAAPPPPAAPRRPPAFLTALNGRLPKP